MEGERLEFCIPQDILFEILVRVPAEHALKLKSVSKQWCNLISGNEFKTAHLQHQKSSTPKLIVKYQVLVDHASLDIKTMRYQKLSLRSLLSNKLITVLDSLDGLLLFRPRREKQIFICNPITRKLKLLLTIPARWEDYKYFYKLVFDTKLQKYKVIGICYSSCTTGLDHNYCVLAIHGDLVRKKLENPSFLHTYLFSEFTPVIIDGVLYWIAYKMSNNGSKIRDEENGYYIQTMDIVKEEFKEMIKIPCQCDVIRRSCSISLSAMVMKGGLSLTISMPVSDNCIGVWALMDSNDENKKVRVWVKLHCINLPIDAASLGHELMICNHWQNFFHFYVITDINGNQKLNNLFIRSSSLELWSYNLKYRNLTKIRGKGSGWFQYVHSLISWD